MLKVVQNKKNSNVTCAISCVMLCHFMFYRPELLPISGQWIKSLHVWIVSFSTVNSQASFPYIVALFILGGLEMSVCQHKILKQCRY